jgi:hypothetical protein
MWRWVGRIFGIFCYEGALAFGLAKLKSTLINFPAPLLQR